MILSKSEFIELMVGFVEGEDICVQVMRDAYTKKKPIWEKNEWIYVKDIEMSLKGIYRIHKNGDFNDFKSVKSFLLDKEDRVESISNEWIRGRLRDCRNSLDSLSLL